MKYLIALGMLILLSGCESTDPDDRDFFYGGWTKPRKDPGDSSMFR